MIVMCFVSIMMLSDRCFTIFTSASSWHAVWRCVLSICTPWHMSTGIPVLPLTTSLCWSGFLCIYSKLYTISSQHITYTSISCTLFSVRVRMIFCGGSGVWRVSLCRLLPCSPARIYRVPLSIHLQLSSCRPLLELCIQWTLSSLTDKINIRLCQVTWVWPSTLQSGAWLDNMLFMLSQSMCQNYIYIVFWSLSWLCNTSSLFLRADLPAAILIPTLS